MLPARRPSAGRGNSKIWQTQGIPSIRAAPRSVPCRDVARLLVVEDDDAISEPLVRALAREGHEVAHAVTGAEALAQVDEGDLDLVVLDIGLPDIDGVDVCRRIRAGHARLAILILTARSSELDEISGLDAGADDYLTKPFSLSVLSARVRALLRRNAPVGGVERAVGGVRVEAAARRAWRDDHELELSPKEFDLLALLVERAGEAVSRDEIMTTVWDENWWARRRRSTRTSAGCGASSATRRS